jgi:hypothetical protein
VTLLHRLISKKRPVRNAAEFFPSARRPRRTNPPAGRSSRRWSIGAGWHVGRAAQSQCTAQPAGHLEGRLTQR